MAGTPQPFHLVYPGTVRDRLQEWGRQASDPALRASLAKALHTIEKQLATDPLHWGEAAFDLHKAGLAVCNGFHERIQVRYAVDETRRIVYVAWFKLLPGHPLAPPS
jgi:hypothetical protein